MSTNTGIYGTPEQWDHPTINYIGTDRTKMFLNVYFGSGRTIQNIYFPSSSL